MQRVFRRKFQQPYFGPSLKPKSNVEDRQQWSRKSDFIMACIGYAVGLGNVWRFPYLCYKNGGGAFLIPYLIMAFTCGVPLFFLEIAIGQFTGQGCVTCWKICPIFKGIGYGIVVLCTWLNMYYIVVLAWAIYYFVMSFTLHELPWTHCNNPWNTNSCVVSFSRSRSNVSNYNISDFANVLNSTKNVTGIDSVDEFWYNKILQKSSGIQEIGSMNIGMVACLAAAWALNYFIIWKGVKVSGKIVYVTAIFPYIMLVVLFIRGVTLEGASDGILFYLKPNFTKLLEPTVWLQAGTQIFFSYAVSTGALIAMGSYNKFDNNCYTDTWIICLVNSLTSFVAGFCIFSVLGYMANDQHKAVADVASDGPGLAFIAYPKALSLMPFAPLWSILFFLMLIMLGIDSQFVGLEGLFTALLDIFPEMRHGHRPEVVIAIACVLYFLFGLIMCTEGGVFVFEIFDYYSASGFVLLWFCFFECVAIAWIYGAQRFYSDIQVMTGRRIGPLMLIAWGFLAPITSLIIFFMSLFNHEPIKTGDYVYPEWADGLGWFLAISSMVCIPIYAVYAVIRAPGHTFMEKLWFTCRPEYETEEMDPNGTRRLTMRGIEILEHMKTDL